jgi:hypothetical protein
MITTIFAGQQSYGRRNGCRCGCRSGSYDEVILQNIVLKQGLLYFTEALLLWIENFRLNFLV